MARLARFPNLFLLRVVQPRPSHAPRTSVYLGLLRVLTYISVMSLTRIKVLVRNDRPDIGVRSDS